MIELTIKEQIRRILRAAPHLPIQALTGIAILFFGIPMLLNQLVDSGFITWDETQGTVSVDKGVQDRIRNRMTEYFYSVDYRYTVNGQSFTLSFEKSYDEKEPAEDGLKEILAESLPKTIWYDRSNPSIAAFDKQEVMWPTYLGVLGILILPLLYFRWLMLKYYELELEEEK